MCVHMCAYVCVCCVCMRVLCMRAYLCILMCAYVCRHVLCVSACKTDAGVLVVANVFVDM